MSLRLRALLDVFVVVYLDDIIVYRNTLKDHVKHLWLALEKIREYKLYLKSKKCEFGQREVEFLGHVIGGGDVKMDSKNIKFIMEWSTPTKISKL